MEEIYLNKRLSNDEILKTISEIFTELQVFHWISRKIPRKTEY
jgi:hypothetical protein